MSYPVKYRLEAYSAKYKDLYKVDIYEIGYTGEVLYKNLGEGKLLLTKAAGSVIQHTSLHIDIQADSNFEYLGFFQYDNRKHLVKLFKNDVQIWSGYIVAESYQEPYINPPYDVQIVASDGLGFLKTYKFDNDGTQSRLDGIRHCIDNLGLELDYNIGIDLFEVNMSTDESLLSQLYYYGEIFKDQNCEDVIKNLLPFGTIITQSNNQWLIRRPYEDSEKTHFIYDYQGNLTGTQNGETLLSMGDLVNGGIWPHGSALLTMEHAYSLATVTEDFGIRESMLRNFDFSLGNFNYWEFYGIDEAEIRKLSDVYYAWLPGWRQTTDPDLNEQYIYQTIQVQKSIKAGGFVVKFKYAHIGGEYKTQECIEFVKTLSVYQMAYIRLVGATANYYLTENGWTNSPTKIQIQVSTVQILEWNTIEIITDGIPFDGTLQIWLYKVPFNAVNSRYQIKGTAYTDIEVYTINRDEFSEDNETEIIIRPNAPEDCDIELKPVDLPDIDNAHLMFDNGNFYKNGSDYLLTHFWKNNSQAAIKYFDVLKAQLIKYYGQPRHVLSSCLWRGEGLHLNSIAQHQLNNERIFVADSGDYQILEDVLNINWIEKPGSASGVEWILEDALWGDSGEIWVDDETWEDIDTDLIVVNIDVADRPPDGFYDITNDVGISNGDSITKLWTYLWVSDKLYQDSNVINSVPHTFTGTKLYFYMPLIHTQSFQTSFEAIISGVYKKVQIIVNA